MTAPFVLIWAIVGGSIVGCGQSLPETIPVQGTVTIDGQPLSSGMITFMPSAGIGDQMQCRPAKGYLDADGRYRLSTFRTFDGALPGEYTVLITPLSTEAMVDGPAAEKAATIPPNAEGNNATVEVEPGKQTFDFHLKPPASDR